VTRATTTAATLVREAMWHHGKVVEQPQSLPTLTNFYRYDQLYQRWGRRRLYRLRGTVV
jgi:hypothetical protein